MGKRKTLVIKGTTNDGCLAKQYCVIAKNESKGFETAVVIRRLVLTDDLYGYIRTEHILLRRFKGRYLVCKTFSIKLSTLNIITNWANGECKEKGRKRK